MSQPIVFNKVKTDDLYFDLKPLIQQPISFKRAQKLARKMGCTVHGTESQFLFWNPGFKEAESAELELFIPNRYLNFDKPEQHATFRYLRLPLKAEGEFAAAVVEGAPVGNKETFGALYQVKLHYENGRVEIIRDPMTASMPYGIFAPSEVYDIDAALSDRSDSGYFKNLETELTDDLRIKPSVNLLEIHVQTATRQGTLHSLKERYKQIAAKLRSGTELTPDEKNMAGFDAIELMPLEPVIEHPENHEFWDPVNTPETDGGEITVRLRRPCVLNWGYDVTIFGSAAVNPSLLSSGRPDELLELIETLHNFPKPVKVVLDVVFGHAHNMALHILPDIYFGGPNEYGQDIRIHHPLVRAIILEMQRRKINFGFDGIRVDASQDFKYYDKGKEKKLCDDDFLREMSSVLQSVAGVNYRPWMIFEDGRPWPRDDWKLTCTYREVTKDQPHAFQWAPMIFAYNTPYKYTYWVTKWWRLREMLLYGDKWIGGYANHDTMRRGTQADPEQMNINTQLGNSLKMVMENAYNNPSTTLLMHGFMPGVPMDFLHALGSTPWSFVRDTDTYYAVKVVSEEVHFFNWQVTENEYRQSRFFKRLKGLGFENLKDLRTFSKALSHFVKATDYSMPSIVSMLNSFGPGLGITVWDQEKLTAFATAWMHDINEYSNVDNHAQYVNAKKASFNLEIRKFRLKNSWLIKNLRDNDMLSYIEPVNGTVIYYGYRRDPESGKEVAIVANMEGQPRQVVPSDLLSVEAGDSESWGIACSTPTLTRKKINEPVRLSVSQGLLFERG
ncbi:hypothetical protein BH23BAC3_BH23BAC3_08190 [soil metagenome]